MSSPTISKGQTFANYEQITAQKLHNLLDRATWEITSQVAGDMIYFNGTNWVRLAKGAEGQILVMNAGATAPSWVNPTLVNLPIWHTAQTLSLTLVDPSVTIA